MEVSIGLPNAVPGTTGDELVEWARRADSRGFASLGTIDRIVYLNYEPMTALAAAAAVTEQIGLCTSVLLGPLRTNAVELAKRALSLNALSGGRFTLGIGLGAREDDYEVSGVEYAGRGRRFTEQLERIKRTWAEDGVGPDLAGPPQLVVGGHADASFARAARFGDGWIAGGTGPEDFANLVAKARAAWSEAGRDGEPRTMGICYYALGESAEEGAQNALGSYYAWLGEAAVAFMVGNAATDAEDVRGYLRRFGEAGCGELIFLPCISDPAQVDLLADAAGL
jgi:alkanesulfonate monooxygenase SsuD/methylene tetrahydromethanopterin reductase-like flavin-dependent oxidoreductase (luciferase family)